jgi:xylulokinase
LLERAQLDREKLPALRPTAEVLGKITPQAAEELGLTSEVKVVVGTPDLQSAAVGSGAVLDYQPHLYIGTSSWLTCHVPFKKVDIFHNIATLPSALPGKYFVANEQECAGACLTYLSDNLFFHEDELDTGSKPPNVYKVFDRIAEKAPPGSNKLIFTPWLYGERTPVDDHSVRGAFFNQSLHTTREDLIRSVFEGVAYNSKWLLGYVEKFVKRRLDPINLVGGGAQSRIWCQIYADVLNRTIRQVKDPILVNTRGAAFLASMALGELRVEDIPARVEIEETFEPKPENRQIYNDLYREFLNLYKAAGSIHKRLNKIPLRIAKGN